jgi:1-phosphofructokinase family hexose kinase
MARLILTVTVNPAYDVSYETTALERGQVHRVAAVHRRPGGKGVNVAAVLATLGEPVVACGFASTGFADDVERLGVRAAFTEALPHVRSTVAVFDGEHTTSLWEPGVAPTDPAGATSALCDQVTDLLPAVGCLVVSGSVPPGVGHTLPADLARLALDRGVPALVDVSGEALEAAAGVPGVVLTPNADELTELCGPVAAGDDVVAAARSLVDRGTGPVFATRGADGIVLVTADDAWLVVAVPGVRGNPTGAGDAAAAAIARGLAAGLHPAQIAEDAVALAATALTSPVAGSVDPDRYHAHRAVVSARPLISEDVP